MSKIEVFDTKFLRKNLFILMKNFNGGPLGFLYFFSKISEKNRDRPRYPEIAKMAIFGNQNHLDIPELRFRDRDPVSPNFF
jgi:hypothetical protein